MYDENHTNWHVKYIIESRHASIILGGYGKILKQFELFTILVFEGSLQQSNIIAVWTVTTRAIFHHLKWSWSSCNEEKCVP